MRQWRSENQRLVVEENPTELIEPSLGCVVNPTQQIGSVGQDGFGGQRSSLVGIRCGNEAQRNRDFGDLIFGLGEAILERSPKGALSRWFALSAANPVPAAVSAGCWNPGE